MLQRALHAEIPFTWYTADEAFGQVKYLRVWLEEHDVSYVVATRCNDDVSAHGIGHDRVDTIIAGLPAQAWKRLSAGDGAHGPRVYDWARVPIRPYWAPGISRTRFTGFAMSPTTKTAAGTTPAPGPRSWQPCATPPSARHAPSESPTSPSAPGITPATAPAHWHRSASFATLPGPRSGSCRPGRCPAPAPSGPSLAQSHPNPNRATAAHATVGTSTAAAAIDMMVILRRLLQLFLDRGPAPPTSAPQ